MDALALTELITVTATYIADNTTQDEAALLSAVFTQLGDTLATIAAVNALNANIYDEIIE